MNFDPRHSLCVSCQKPFEQPTRPQGGGSTQLFCSPKCRSREWARGNPGKRSVTVKKYDHKKESKEQKRERARRATLAQYGITEEQFEAQLQRQRMRCYGCLSDIDRTTAQIDHNHDDKTPHFRGLLCVHCNWTLGHVRDNRETLYRLAAYLRYEAKKFNVYMVGSLRNPAVQDVAEAVRGIGCAAFDEWITAGPEADDYFQQYWTRRQATYADALASRSAQHVFYFDRAHLDMADAGILVMPAGKSGHLELGYLSGQGKPTFILLDKEPERYDIMPQFATAGIFTDAAKLIERLQTIKDGVAL